MKQFQYLYKTYGNDKLDTIDIYEYDSSELKFFIAIDSLRNSSAVGACRFINNVNREVALRDVCRMARTMTEKNMIAGLPYGGGKAYIYYSTVDHETMLKKFADALNSLNGIYYTTNDIGTSVDDMVYLRRFTPYAKGSKYLGKEIPATAYSVFLSLKVAARVKYNLESLVGTTVSIQGVGSVGLPLLQFLINEGCNIIVDDIDKGKLHSLQKIFDFKICEGDFVTQKVDFVVPCAVGGVITDSNIEEITAKIICGGANNQLSQEALDTRLYKNGILFIPDMLANCGGMIDLFCEGSNYCKKYVFDSIEPIAKKVEYFIKASEKNGVSVNTVLREWLLKKIQYNV